MATSTGVLVEDRVVFDCPKCGVHHDGPLTVTVESETMDAEIDMFDTITVSVRQTMRTSACRDVFTTRTLTDEPTFEMTLISYENGRPAVLHVVPTYEGADHDAA